MYRVGAQHKQEPSIIQPVLSSTHIDTMLYNIKWHNLETKYKTTIYEV